MSRDNGNRIFDLLSGLLESEVQSMFAPTRNVTTVTSANDRILTTLVQSPFRVIIYAEMPGFDKQSIDIDFHTDRLDITGRKIPPVLLDDEKTSYSGIRYGTFTGSVKLPITVLEKEKVNVKYENGVLRILICLENNDVGSFKINLGESTN